VSARPATIASHPLPCIPRFFAVAGFMHGSGIAAARIGSAGRRDENPLAQFKWVSEAPTSQPVRSVRIAMWIPQAFASAA
jgi:hypothetical protein